MGVEAEARLEEGGRWSCTGFTEVAFFARRRYSPHLKKMLPLVKVALVCLMLVGFIL